MFFSDKIILRSVETAQDADGYGNVEINTDTEVWANIKSVARSEFYAANANKIDVVIAFDVHVEDFSNQTRVLCNDKTYFIIRSYMKGLGIIELNCSDKAMPNG